MWHPSQSCSMHAAQGNWRRGCLCSSGTHDGQRCAELQLQPILHHACGGAPVRRQARGDRRGGPRLGHRRAHRCSMLLPPCAHFWKLHYASLGLMAKVTKCDTSEAVSVAKCQQPLGCDLPCLLPGRHAYERYCTACGHAAGTAYVHLQARPGWPLCAEAEAASVDGTPRTQVRIADCGILPP